MKADMPGVRARSWGGAARPPAARGIAVLPVSAMFLMVASSSGTTGAEIPEVGRPRALIWPRGTVVLPGETEGRDPKMGLYPHPHVAARAIRELLLDESSQVDPLAAARAILKYGAFAEAPHLWKYVRVLEERYRAETDERFRHILRESFMRLLEWIAVFTPEGSELWEKCARKTESLHAEGVGSDGPDEFVESCRTVHLARMYWVLGNDEKVQWYRDVAHRRLRRFAEEYPAYNAALEQGNGDLMHTVKDEEYPPEAELEIWFEAQDILSFAGWLLEYSELRRPLKPSKGLERWIPVAFLAFADNLEQPVPDGWATAKLLRETDRCTRSQAIRGAIRRMMSRPPEGYDDARLNGTRRQAYVWLSEYGDGLMPDEKEDMRRIHAGYDPSLPVPDTSFPLPEAMGEDAACDWPTATIFAAGVALASLAGLAAWLLLRRRRDRS